MKITTTRFGEIIVDETRIVTMRGGILGFERLERYVFLAQDEKIPFWVFQSVENPSVAFVVVDPFQIRPDYRPECPAADRQLLEITSPEDIMVRTLVTVDPDPGKVTTNLRAPILVNVKKMVARQVVLMDDEYPVRYRLMDAVAAGTEQHPAHHAPAAIAVPVP